MDDNDKPRERVILPSIETPTLTKAELADLLFERLGLNKRESRTWSKASSTSSTRRWCRATT